MLLSASILVAAALLSRASPPAGWTTCGGLPDALNATACPPHATCCHQRWAPGAGSWGCIDNDAWGSAAAAGPATCCGNNYTACPAAHTCADSGRGAMVVSTCHPRGGGGGDTVIGRQVCKQGAPLPLSSTLPNILIVGDSVSIGYTPLIASYMASEAFVQHSPWGGDGGAEEAAYGVQCLDYLLRAPDGTPLSPDVLMFNWGLHSRFPSGSTPIVPGQHGDPRVYAANLEKVTLKLKAWCGLRSCSVMLCLAGLCLCLPCRRVPVRAWPLMCARVPLLRVLHRAGAKKVKLLFAITSPMLNSKTIDDVVVPAYLPLSTAPPHNAEHACLPACVRACRGCKVSVLMGAGSLGGVPQVGLNTQAAAIMDRHQIPTVDLHSPIIAQCGAVPQASCWGQTGCWSPHCPCSHSSNCCPCTPPSNCPCTNSSCPVGSCPCAAALADDDDDDDDGKGAMVAAPGSVCGYGWLANGTIVPALRSLLPAAAKAVTVQLA
jgi:hypothetical protein